MHLQALTRKFSLAADVDLPALGAACPQQLTGADLYALCADAWMEALKRRIRRDESSTAAAVTGLTGTLRLDNNPTRSWGDGPRGNVGSAAEFAPSSSHSVVHVDDNEDLYGGSPSDLISEGGLGGGNAGKYAVSLGEGVDDALLRVSQIDFLTALRNLVPSLSMEELQKYERLRDHYEGRG